MLKTHLYSFSSFFLALAILSSYSCNKEYKTIILHFNTTDVKTGLPISGAYASFTFYTTDSHGGLFQSFASATSDSNGSFVQSYGSNGEQIEVLTISKPGYFGVFSTIDLKILPNKNDYNVKMIPSDGKLNLKLSNETGQHDSLYIRMYHTLYHPNYHTPYQGSFHYPEILKKGESVIQESKSSTEEKIYIYWDFHDISSSVKNATYIDSFYINKNDSIKYEIKY
jgi:hypothetical protein